MNLNEKLNYNRISDKMTTGRSEAYISLHNDTINSKENKQFLSVVSHNIRNPISTVSGYSEMIIEDLPDLLKDELLTYLVQIKKNADITYNYINKFFEWVYYKTEKINLEPQFLNLYELIELTLSDISKEHRYFHNINIDIDPSIDIFADKCSVMKIFFYLIENAILYTHDNGTIHIKAITDKDAVILDIVDSGIGIKDDLLEVLFDKTKNIKLFKNNVHDGTGLSLILVDEFIKLNKGSLNIKSKVNVGTTVSVKLPC